MAIRKALDKRGRLHSALRLRLNFDFVYILILKSRRYCSLVTLVHSCELLSVIFIGFFLHKHFLLLYSRSVQHTYNVCSARPISQALIK